MTTFPSSVPVLLATLLSAFASAQVDHRPAQSPVKDQGGRGTCVAFAVCAALETFPGVPTDVSEQLLYATVKRHENAVDRWRRALGREAEIAAGNQFSEYLHLFDLLGTCHESFLPYDRNPRRAAPGVPVEIRRYLELAQVTERDLAALRDRFGKYGFKAADCDVLAAAAARDVARLRNELDGGRLAIPVIYALYGPKWGAADDDPKRAHTMIHPGLMWQYRLPGSEPWLDFGAIKLLAGARGIDFVDGVRDGRIEAGRFPDPKGELYSGHAVTIVGYDQRGFLAKNSWGTTWGDDGYCVIHFDYHALFANSALLIDRAYVRAPVLSPFAQRAAIAKADFRVKVMPCGAGADARLVLSSWACEPRDPDVEVYEYDVEVRGAGGGWQRVVKELVRVGDTETRNGAPLVLHGQRLARLRAGERARVTVRYGGSQVVDERHPERATFQRTVRFAAFAPWPSGALDLLPAN